MTGPSLEFLHRGFTEEQRASLIDYLQEYRDRNTLLTITIDNLRRQIAELFDEKFRAHEDGPDAFQRLRDARNTIDDFILRTQTATRNWHYGDPLPESYRYKDRAETKVTSRPIGA